MEPWWLRQINRFNNLMFLLLMFWQSRQIRAGEKPTIVEHPLDILVVRGDPATLRCGTTGENVVISWYKDGELVKVGSAHRLILPNGSLLLLKVNSGGADSEAGTYYCTARNDYGEVRSQEANVRVASLRDEFRANPHAVQALMGSQAVLECSPPKGFPEPMVTWRRDDKDVNFGEETRYKLHPSGNFIIENVGRSDAGFYQCVATNMVGERISKAARLSVYEKPRFLAEPKNLTAEANASVLFECRVAGEPLPSISWKKRGEQMPVGRAYVTKDSHGLQIDNVQSEDAGEYICVAKNPVGSVETSARLQVNAPPRFTKFPENVRAAAGETAAFACEADGRPQPGIFWSKEGDQDFTFFAGLVSTDGRIQVASDGRLLIDGVRASDAGNYVCAAVNAVGSTLAKASLTVSADTNTIHPPPVITYGHQNQTLMVSDMAILPCQANGRLQPTVRWWKNGVPLTLADADGNDASHVRYRQLVTGTLQILDLTKEDSGVYTCRAKNEDGEATWTASLLVEEHTNLNTMFQRMPEAGVFPSAPGRPRALNVSHDWIELEWMTPEKQGATPIVGYILQYWSPSLRESWMNVPDVVTSSRFIVRRLRPSTSYAFVVRAENAKGIGPPSETSELMATKPSSHEADKDHVSELLDLEAARKRLAAEQLVKLVEVRPLNATAMLLAWRRQRHEPLVHGYYIKWRGPPLAVSTAGGAVPPEHSWVNVSDATSESAVVGGLRPANHYEFFVIPYHQSVQGMPSNSLDGTTAEDVPAMPPSDVRLRLLNITSLRVSWRAPPAHAMNGALKGYLINIRSNQSEERNITTNERATSVTLYRLIADASYAIRVAARTSAGYGPFFVGEPVVMNEDTLQHHIRLASDLRHGDAWYRQSLGVLTVGIALWCVLLMLIVFVWYRCCHRPGQRRKSAAASSGGGDATKDAREFIKIRDGSVVAIGGPGNGLLGAPSGTMARNAAFWNAGGAGDYSHTASSMGLSGKMAADGCFNGHTCSHHNHHHHHLSSKGHAGHGECVNCGIYAGGGGTESDYCMSGGTLPAIVHCGNGNAPSYYGVGAATCLPVSCSTLQKISSARSHSPSHHYHYAQLPDVTPGAGGGSGNDLMSTFYNQSTNQLYYDDPSPYATTTLVMSERSTHTPRAVHRGGTIGHSHSHHHGPQSLHHHVHNSHGNLAALIGQPNGTGIQEGPLLPLNPVPKEPPRNFLSNTAVDATTGAKAPTGDGCCDAQPRSSHRSSCCAAAMRRSCGTILSATCCDDIHNNNNNNNNSKSALNNNHHFSQQQYECCAIAGNKSSQCYDSKNLPQPKCCGSQPNFNGTRLPPNDSSAETSHEYTPSHPHRSSPYTDVSYIQSSDGTNGSAKAAPPAHILDLVPPPPSEPPRDLPPGALYDAVSDANANGGAAPSHQKAFSAEIHSTAATAASRTSLHGVNRSQRRGERYSSGSMSRARSRSNKSNEPKSRLSLMERDDADEDFTDVASSTTDGNFRNGAARYGAPAAERDPLLAPGRGGAAVPNDADEADDETSGAENNNNNNVHDGYFNNNNCKNSWIEPCSPREQEPERQQDRQAHLKSRRPMMGVHASAISHDSPLNVSNRMSTSRLHT